MTLTEFLLAQRKRGRSRYFWDYVDKTSHPTGCWIWNGVTNRGGYGTWRRMLAHRLSLALVSTPPSGDLFACHRCDNPPCVNPDHLYWGTRTDNGRDIRERGGSWNRGTYAAVCKNGHALDGSNLRTVGNHGKRVCRECDNKRARDRMAEPAQCDECGVTVRRGNLTRHRRAKHG